VALIIREMVETVGLVEEVNIQTTICFMVATLYNQVQLLEDLVLKAETVFLRVKEVHAGMEAVAAEQAQ
jgi:hypothetical protein